MNKNQKTNKPSKETLHNVIVSTIGKRIISGTYKENEVLENEAKIGNSLNASRTATREALKILSSKGLIESRPKIGTVIKAKEHWNMLDPMIIKWCLEDPLQSKLKIDEIYAMRLAFEPECALLAAVNHTPDDIKAMRQALRGMSVYTDTEDKIQSDLAFHTSILHATKNNLFIALGSIVAAGLEHIFRFGLEATDDEDDKWVDRHKAVAEAIKNKDGKKAKAQMKILLLEAKENHCAE